MPQQYSSPKEFLRSRRPERFSDSIITDTPEVDRSILEYHLDTITNRNQEAEYARFAKELAQREICPNLLPQTGPTGGGDSKVDSETYPIADDLALAWFTGIGREAAVERWAFAFSAKEDWRTKVRSDIAKIAGTGRGYTKAFFVSSRFVRDKERGEIEDELRQRHALDVRILDRTWILDRTFRNHHEQLAIDELDVTALARRDNRKGPLDTQREVDLAVLEARIQSATTTNTVGVQLVDDAIESAKLARELERPRTEVDGRFDRARNLATKYGLPDQSFLAAYDRAWTTFWWYEDYPEFVDRYGEVEVQAIGTQNAHHLELLSNLWYLLHTVVAHKWVPETEAHFEPRTQTLLGELERLSNHDERPSGSLQARTLLLQVKLVLAPQADRGAIFDGLGEVVERSQGLVGYPLQPLAEILGELGQFVGDEPAYNNVFETILDVMSRREGEVAASRMLLRRAAQQLDAGRPYDAIRVLGRGLTGLFKHESREDLIRALYLCGAAYEKVGLLWAARGVLLCAASIATAEFWTYTRATRLQAGCYRHLKWLELQLGRLPQLLSWHELDTVFRHILLKDSDETIRAGEVEFDTVLGRLLLASDLWELKQLSRVPDVLEQLQLFNAAVALHYALGYEDVPAEYLTDEVETVTPAVFMTRWWDQPAGDDVPDGPDLYSERKVLLRSSILGCAITVETLNESPCVEIAESLLAASESVLSTAISEPLMAREPECFITVGKSHLTSDTFEFESSDNRGRPRIEIRCGNFNPNSMPVEVQSRLKDKLFEVIAHLMGRIFALGDPETTLKKLFRDERALERALNFTSSLVVVGNVLGHKPKTTLGDWDDPDATEYPLLRGEVWNARVLAERAIVAPVTETLVPGQGDVPTELLDSSKLRHSDITVVSLIRESLWKEADWNGTGFLISVRNLLPPILALLFRKESAAEEIFRQWVEELGEEDERNLLRLSVIRGIDRRLPHSYAVVVSANPDAVLLSGQGKQANIVVRMHRMNPSTSDNLNRFLDSYTAIGSYLLGPGKLEGDQASPIGTYHLRKTHLNVKDAWQIGRHDPEAIALHEDDDPIIPKGELSPPVAEVLNWLRSTSRPSKVSKGERRKRRAGGRKLRRRR